MRMRGEATQGRSLVGFYKNKTRLERTVRDLKSSGFDGEDITVSMQDQDEAERLSDRLGIVDAQTSAQWLRGGTMLLGVECDDRCDEASRILSDNGAEDIRWARILFAETERPMMREREAAPTEGQTIPIREEELRTRRERHRGEVEVSKHVVEEERTMRVPVTHEEVVIERRRVEGPADRGPEEGTVTIPVYEEEIVLEKRPRLVEEIRITKRPVTEEREVRGTIRKEVPEIKRKGEIHEEDIKERRY